MPQKAGRHWQRRPEVQGLLERKKKKNQAASERSDLVKSRQGIGLRASLGPEPQLTQSNDTRFYERENMDSPKTQEKETH